MVTNEEYKIILRVEGEDRVAKLAEEIRKEEKALLDLGARLRATGATQDQIIKGTAVYAQSIANLNQQLAAAQKQVSEAGGRFQAMSQGLVQLGYAVDDVQYGMKGLANNIQPLLMAFGVGAGLAGVIGIVVTATTVLVDKWGKLMDAMGMGKVKTAADEMKELAAMTERTVEQTARLERLQAKDAAGDALKGGMPKAEAARRAAAIEAINEAGGQNALIAGVRNVRERGVDGLNPNAAGYEQYLIEKDKFENPNKYATRNAKTGVSNADTVKAAARAAMTSLAASNRTSSADQASELLKGAVMGDAGAMDALMGIVSANPGAFPEGAANNLRKGTKAAVRDQRLQSIADEMGADIERSNKAYKAEADRKNRLMDGVNADVQRQEGRRQELSDYFNNIKPGPDAETQQFLDRQQRMRDEQNAKIINARVETFRNMGGGGAVNDAAIGMMMNGASPEAARRMLTRQLSSQVGMMPAMEMAKDAVQQGMGAMFSMQYEQMRAAMGPRQIHGYAEFKDAVTTADPMANAMRAQVEASNKANVILDQIRQAVTTRTFRAAAS